MWRVALGIVVGVLLWAAPTQAAERYASPGGMGVACTEANPCSLATASDDLNTTAGDEIIVTPGNYSISDISIFDTGIEIHGQDGQPRPTITTSGFGLYLFSATKVRDLNLVTTANTAFSYFEPGSVIERVTASATSLGAVPCQLGTSVTIRDSVCRSTGVNGRGIGGNFGLLSGSHLVKLRNVTVVGTSAGLGINVQGSGVDFDLDAKNVIAQGGPSGTDVTATAEAGTTVDVTLANSNYATKTQFNNGVSVNVTNPGTGTNQTAEPVFIDAAAGDFHQAASSPTIDAGVLDADVGTNDFEGDARSLEGNGSCPAAPVPDIGADERDGAVDCPDPPNPPNPPVGDTVPPETTITKAPAKKVKSKKKKAKLSATFSSNEAGRFECSLDGASFSACSSPFAFKAAKGKHELRVRAIDSAGNVDATPASASFTVKVKKKKKKK